MVVDELDKRIVAALVSDARATYAEVGAQVGLSAPAVKRRVDRLRASGAITGFSAAHPQRHRAVPAGAPPGFAAAGCRRGEPGPRVVGLRPFGRFRALLA